MNPFSNIIDGINKYDFNSSFDFNLSEEDCTFIDEQSRLNNEELAVKEAGSWELANRLVLTD